MFFCSWKLISKDGEEGEAQTAVARGLVWGNTLRHPLIPSQCGLSSGWLSPTSGWLTLCLLPSHIPCLYTVCLTVRASPLPLQCWKTPQASWGLPALEGESFLATPTSSWVWLMMTFKTQREMSCGQVQVGIDFLFFRCVLSPQLDSSHRWSVIVLSRGQTFRISELYPSRSPLTGSRRVLLCFNTIVTTYFRVLPPPRA